MTKTKNDSLAICCLILNQPFAAVFVVKLTAILSPCSLIPIYKLQPVDVVCQLLVSRSQPRVVVYQMLGLDD